MIENNNAEFLQSLNLPHDIKNLSYDDLEKVAKETRELIIDVTSKNGGHIAPSLGVVELTIALLRVFDLPKDKIIWDVSHQSYAYKILTDRLNSFHTLRQYKGISGFSRPDESIYDTCISGHASTSISSAIGIILANSILNKEGKAVAVIGDGALTGGLALEALNNIGVFKKNIIIVLNDNEMSISANVGGFSSYLSKSLTSALATKMRYDFKNAAEEAPFGDTVLKIAKKMENMMIGVLSPGAFFENLGIRYIGPIDGHNIKEIEKALSNAQLQKRPVLVHIATKKGKGYEPAEKSPDVFHGVSAFDKETGIVKGKSDMLSWTDVFGRKILSMAETHN
ncbi:MAG: 1-deoxy-D-xylulose-5-phosphate synthase, partial [Mucispirillum sp.]|nr:1-deoxy-D-xylulose-5-phosphate synthase [Mucispirillum sp.]